MQYVGRLVASLNDVLESGVWRSNPFCFWYWGASVCGIILDICNLLFNRIVCQMLCFFSVILSRLLFRCTNIVSLKWGWWLRMAKFGECCEDRGGFTGVVEKQAEFCLCRGGKHVFHYS